MKNKSELYGSLISTNVSMVMLVPHRRVLKKQTRPILRSQLISSQPDSNIRTPVESPMRPVADASHFLHPKSGELAVTPKSCCCGAARLCRGSVALASDDAQWFAVATASL